MTIRNQDGAARPERPRQDVAAWLALAAIVYAWTDGREATQDKAWWQAGGQLGAGNPAESPAGGVSFLLGQLAPASGA